MDINSLNRWNEQARKSQEVADRFHQKVTSHPKIINGSEFICPWCNKRHHISHSKILRIVGTKELIDTQHGFNSTTKTYSKVSYNVRFCEKCFYKNERNKKIFFTIGKLLYGILGVLFLYWLCTTDEKLGFTGWVGAIMGYGLIALVALGLKDSVEENLFDTANIEVAYKNNAIV